MNTKTYTKEEIEAKIATIIDLNPYGYKASQSYKIWAKRLRDLEAEEV